MGKLRTGLPEHQIQRRSFHGFVDDVVGKTRIGAGSLRYCTLLEMKSERDKSIYEAKEKF